MDEENLECVQNRWECKHSQDLPWEQGVTSLLRHKWEGSRVGPGTVVNRKQVQAIYNPYLPFI